MNKYSDLLYYIKTGNYDKFCLYFSNYYSLYNLNIIIDEICFYNHTKMLIYILVNFNNLIYNNTNGEKIINFPIKMGIHYAIYNGNIEIIKLINELKLIEIDKYYTNYSIFYAIHFNKVEMLKFLYNSGFSLKIKKKNFEELILFLKDINSNDSTNYNYYRNHLATLVLLENSITFLSKDELVKYKNFVMYKGNNFILAHWLGKIIQKKF